jgi:cardiolipin synthase
LLTLNEILAQHLQLGLLILHITVSSYATAHALLRKRDSSATIGWVGLIWLSPLIGASIYYLLGINRIQRAAVALAVSSDWQTGRREQTEVFADSRALAEAFPGRTSLFEIAHLGSEVSARPLLRGNRVMPLNNGDEAFPAMLSAINDARYSVTLLTYIFDADPAGSRFESALVSAQRRGVEVRVLIDGLGAIYSKRNMIRRLRQAGVNARAFLPVQPKRGRLHFNLRNHRKILVVDGEIGFTGGTNIRQGHCLLENPAMPARCLHFQLEGPVVRQLQEAFAIDWVFASDEALTGKRWFPDLSICGGVFARGISDGPDEDLGKLTDLMCGAISSATHSVQILTPYFLPDAALSQALAVAAMRGIRVDIVLPSKNNIRLAHWAAMAQLWQLLSRGCRVYLSPEPFDHSKLMVVDSSWSLIGSTNWDPRSLRLNFEFNVECYDSRLGTDLAAIVQQRVEQSMPLELTDLESLPLAARLRNGLARLLSPYL